METLKFKIEIEAPREKVWKVLWDDETYRQWTLPFCEGISEGSYAESDWNEGSKIYFMSSNGDGMNSVIERKITNEYMAFKHIGELKNFVEMPVDAATEQWSGDMETYRLTQNGTETVLEVNLDTGEKYVDYFQKIFPKCLELVKELSEKN